MIVIMVMIVCACRYESTTKIHRKLVKELDFPAISLCSPTIVAESTLSTDSESQDWLRRIQHGSLTVEEFPEARSALRRHNALHALSAHLPSLIEYCWINMRCIFVVLSYLRAYKVITIINIISHKKNS